MSSELIAVATFRSRVKAQAAAESDAAQLLDRGEDVKKAGDALRT